jgi:hypothetical protein
MAKLQCSCLGSIGKVRLDAMQMIHQHLRHAHRAAQQQGIAFELMQRRTPYRALLGDGCHQHLDRRLQRLILGQHLKHPVAAAIEQFGAMALLNLLAQLRRALPNRLLEPMRLLPQAHFHLVQSQFAALKLPSQTIPAEGNHQYR